jgi:hypothetical protein
MTTPKSGPFIKMDQCCPGIKSVGMKKFMVDVRVEATADFSGVELVLISNMKIRLEHFPADLWTEQGTYCAPRDIVRQMEKLDNMIERDAEQTAIHGREKNNFFERQEAQNNKSKLLYEFNERLSVWEEKSVRPDKQTKIRGILWLLCLLGSEDTCYAPIVCAICNGIAPR